MHKLARFLLTLWMVHILLVTLTIAAWRVASRLVQKEPATWVLYTVDQPNGRTQIYRVQADGTETQLLNDQFITVASPTWSPDGYQIAFLAAGDVATPHVINDFRLTLYVMRANGTGLRSLAQVGDPYLFLGDVEWSRDGKRLLFSIEDGAGTPVYYRVAVTGGHLQQWSTDRWVGVDDPANITLAAHDHGDFERLDPDYSIPSWASPDGQWTIDFDFANESGILYRQRLDNGGNIVPGSKPEEVFRTSGAIFPTLWSPDSQAFWFTVVRHADEHAYYPQHGTDLYRVHIGSGKVEKVVSNDNGSIIPLHWLGGEMLILGGSSSLAGATWSNLYLLPEDSAGLSSLADLQPLTQKGISGYMDYAKPRSHPIRWGWLAIIEAVGLTLWLIPWSRYLKSLRNRRLPEYRFSQYALLLDHPD